MSWHVIQFVLWVTFGSLLGLVGVEVTSINFWLFMGLLFAVEHTAKAILIAQLKASYQQLLDEEEKRT